MIFAGFSVHFSLWSCPTLADPMNRSIRVFSFPLLAGLHYTVVPTRVDLLTEGAQVLYTSISNVIKIFFSTWKKEPFFST